MLNPVHLETLRAVVTAGSFSGAARRLGYTASAVSQQIGILERTVGVSLFDRKPSCAHPTPGALLLAREADVILERLRRAELEVRRLSGNAHTLRIGTFMTAARQLLPRALAEAMLAQGGVDIQQVEGRDDALLPMLVAGDLDLALVYRFPEASARWMPSLHLDHLMDEPMMVLLSRADTDRVDAFRREGLAGLADASWITLDNQQAHHRALVEICRAAGFEPRISLEVHSIDVFPPLVEAGIGAAVVPQLGLPDHAGVIAMPLAGVVRQVYAARVQRDEPLVELLIQKLRQTVDDWCGEMGIAS